jgi:hypothetical protein
MIKEQTTFLMRFQRHTVTTYSSCDMESRKAVVYCCLMCPQSIQNGLIRVSNDSHLASLHVHPNFVPWAMREGGSTSSEGEGH